MFNGYKMEKSISRRDFLKLMALLPPSIFWSKFAIKPERTLQNPDAKNILIIVFDTLSAQHASFNGYPRETMPHLARVLDKATVYHNHYAGGNWTTPGTASILTGTYPWTHRAFNQADYIAKDRERNNLFNAFNQFYRIGYSHNSIVDRFLRQFSEDLDFLKPQMDLFVARGISPDRLFPWDNDIASLSWDRIIKKGEKGYTYSPILARLYERYTEQSSHERIATLLEEFPRGIPRIREDDYFLLEDAIEWLISRLKTIPQPFLGYFHYLPPHSPYNTRRDFVNVFAGDSVGYYIEKPAHPFFSKSPLGRPLNLKYQANKRQWYDEFILYSDAEFGRLYDSMEKSGLLETTWLVFTSDHGELFERGIIGHRTPVLYQPVIQVPLVILEPGQTQRRDIYTSTSAVDLLPTLLKITGQPIPNWAEGSILPPFFGVHSDSQRSIYALEATDSNDANPLNPASVMLVKGKYKLTYYFGYKELVKVGPQFELFDLENDPNELNNIYRSDSEIAQELRRELLNKITEVDKPYQG